MPFILQTSGLSKKIGSKALVADVNIHIPKGEIYGFLGPNGAGKTTVMKMITNLWKPTSGTIEVFGEVLTPKSYTVAIIHHGKMMKEIRMQDIEEMNLNYVELSVTDEKRAAYVLTEKLGLQNFKILDSGKIRIYDHAASTQQLTKILALNDVEVVSIGKKSETLEDYFLKLTGEVKYHA